MDDNKSPLTPPTSTLPIEPPPTPPLDLPNPMPKPVSPTPSLDAAPNQKLETPSQPPIEHDITPSIPLPTAQTIPAPENDPAPEVPSASPETPSTIPNMPASPSIPPMTPSTEATAPQTSAVATPPPPPTEPSTIPPMPAIDALPSIPAVNPSVSVAASPVSDIAVPASNEPTVETANANAAPAPAPTEAKPGDDPKPKKSKALVIVVIVLVLVALTLGGLVVWRAMQPATSSIEESMTPPPAIAGVEDVEEIVEEEVIVEQPEAMADARTLSFGLYEFPVPSGLKITKSPEEIGVPYAKLETVTPSSVSFEFGSELELQCVDTDNVVKSSIMIDGKPVEREDFVGSTNPEFGCDQSHDSLRATWIRLPGSIENVGELTLSLTYNANEQNESLEYLDQILSTFTFSDTSTTPGAALQGSCTQDGKTYADGEAVPAPDSCNSCACNDGQIACTLMACEE